MSKEQGFSERHIHSITIVHDRFARSAAEWLSRMFPSSVHMRVASVQQVRHEDFVSSVPEPAMLALINMRPLRGNVLLEMSPAILYSILDRLCGGTGEGADDPHELTDIEDSLTEGLIVNLLDRAREAWEPLARIRPTLEHISSNPLVPRSALPPMDMVLLVNLEIMAGSVKSTLRWCVPYSFVESLTDMPKTPEPETNTKDALAVMADEIKALRQDFSAFQEEALSKIADTIKEHARVPEQTAAEQAPPQGDTLAFFSFEVKNRIEHVVDLVRGFLNDDGDGREKAAVFLTALGSEAAAGIYRHLREDEIETLTFFLSRFDRVSLQQKTAVLDEFHEAYTASKGVLIGGIDYARLLLEETLGAQKAVDIISRLVSSLQVRPFDFVRRCDPEHLLSFIKQERPQIIALVLTYLDPGKAAVILEKLPPELQGGISLRMATMGTISPVILRDVERVLERKLAALASEDYSASGGVENAAEMLSRVDPALKKRIIGFIEKENPGLAADIQAVPVEVEEDQF